MTTRASSSSLWSEPLLSVNNTLVAAAEKKIQACFRTPPLTSARDLTPTTCGQPRNQRPRQLQAHRHTTALHHARFAVPQVRVRKNDYV